MEGNFVKPTDRNYGQQSIVNAQNQNLKNYYSRTPWASSSTSVINLQIEIVNLLE